MPLACSSRFSALSFQLRTPRRSSSCCLPLPAKHRSCRFIIGGPRLASSNCFCRLRKLWLVSAGSVSRGDDLWTLPSSGESEGPAVTVVLALRRIWELIADDRLVVYMAFGSLTVAAVSWDVALKFLNRLDSTLDYFLILFYSYSFLAEGVC